MKRLKQLIPQEKKELQSTTPQPVYAEIKAKTDVDVFYTIPNDAYNFWADTNWTQHIIRASNY